MSFFRSTQTIKEILCKANVGKQVKVYGWVNSCRKQKNATFLHIADGSSVSGIQLVAPSSIPINGNTGSSICAKGILVESLGREQAYEIQLEEMDTIGDADSSYPLQKKYHSPEFLRSINHFRPRTKFSSSVMRLRNALLCSFIDYFSSKQFIQIQAPIITSMNCEGGCDIFQVQKHKVSGYFNSEAYLSTSAQLHAEFLASGLSRVYSIGPTFRAEPHNTPRHLSEFWMVEPEIFFLSSLKDLVGIIEETIKHVVDKVLIAAEDDISFFASQNMVDLMDLKALVSEPFATVSFEEAIGILEKAHATSPFENRIDRKNGLHKEHERFLCEKVFKTPVFVTHFPFDQKPFYMKSSCSGTLMEAVDLLVPKIGELVGGSMREENYDSLLNNMERKGMKEIERYSWYLDLRKYGTAPHGGFGVGFERFIQVLTGIPNIRDTIAVARVPGELSQ